MTATGSDTERLAYLGGLVLTRTSIFQPLAADALNQCGSALFVVHANGFAVEAVRHRCAMMIVRANINFFERGN